MAFESKYKSQGEEMCPICRRQFTDGRRLDIPSYGGQLMCRDCFRQLYKNRQQKRTAAVTDDSANLKQKIRPSQILERPRFLKSTEPAGGYEFVMPRLTHMGMIINAFVWVALVLLVRMMIRLFVPEETPLDFSIAVMGTDCIFAAVSLLWAIISLKDLIKGIALGMGHSRRLILLVTAAAMLFLVYINIPDILQSWLIEHFQRDGTLLNK